MAFRLCALSTLLVCSTHAVQLVENEDPRLAQAPPNAKIDKYRAEQSEIKRQHVAQREEVVQALEAQKARMDQDVAETKAVIKKYIDGVMKKVDEERQRIWDMYPHAEGEQAPKLAQGPPNAQVDKYRAAQNGLKKKWAKQREEVAKVMEEQKARRAKEVEELHAAMQKVIDSIVKRDDKERARIADIVTPKTDQVDENAKLAQGPPDAKVDKFREQLKENKAKREAETKEVVRVLDAQIARRAKEVDDVHKAIQKAVDRINKGIDEERKRIRAIVTPEEVDDNDQKPAKLAQGPPSAKVDTYREQLKEMKNKHAAETAAVVRALEAQTAQRAKEAEETHAAIQKAIDHILEGVDADRKRIAAMVTPEADKVQDNSS